MRLHLPAGEMVNYTRLTAYEAILENLTERQGAVLEAIKGLGGRATMHQVAEAMHVPLNTISGRFSELRRLNLIKEFGITQDKRKKTIFEVL